MALDASISRLLKEIVAYDGNFGDPVSEFVDFEPLRVLEADSETHLRAGAAVALLVNFMSDIDNSGFDAATKGNACRELRSALDYQLFAAFPLVEEAALQASVSESAFMAALAPIYLKHVKPCC